MVRDEWTKAGTAQPEPVNRVAAPAASLLTRPAFGPDVPAVIQRNPLSNTGALALLLLDAGILAETDWRRSRKRLEAQCQAALTRWINEKTQGLRCIQPRFELNLGQRYSYPTFSSTDMPALLRVIWHGHYPDAFVVGPQVERLEKIKKGLGLAALRALSQYSWLTFPLMLCQHQLDLAQWFFWGGEDGLEDYIKNMELDPEEAEHVRATHISEHDIHASTPKWVLKSYRKKTPAPRTLRQIERRSDDPLAREVALVLRQLADSPELPNPHDYLSDDGDFFGYVGFVRWSHSDYTIDVADQLANYSMNGGVGYDICGLHEQSVNDLDEFKGWMRHVDNLMAVTRLVDHLLWLLSGASSEYAHT